MVGTAVGAPGVGVVAVEALGRCGSVIGFDRALQKPLHPGHARVRLRAVHALSA